MLSESSSFTSGKRKPCSVLIALNPTTFIRLTEGLTLCCSYRKENRLGQYLTNLNNDNYCNNDRFLRGLAKIMNQKILIIFRIKNKILLKNTKLNLLI